VSIATGGAGSYAPRPNPSSRGDLDGSTLVVLMRMAPGRRPQWGAFIRDVKKVVEKHGSPLRALQLQFGGHPGTALVSAQADNWEQLATRTEKVNADPEMQALMSRSSKLSGVPFSDAVEVRVLPGKRAKQIEVIRQIREARTGAGLPVSNVLQTALGSTANVLATVRPYANLQAWAKDRATPELKSVTDILQRVQADGPYAETLSIRLYTDITNQL